MSLDFVKTHVKSIIAFVIILAIIITVIVLIPKSSLKKCPGDCNKNGICDTSTGICKCATGWSGGDCSIGNTGCRFNCYGPTHGTCNDGICECVGNFQSPYCENASCPNDCTSPDRGVCDTTKGTCTCTKPYYGSSCNKQPCPDDCSGPGNGICNDDGTCTCNPGFSGPSCVKNVCKDDCSGQGLCNDDGSCTCKDGFVGPTCAISTWQTDQHPIFDVTTTTYKNDTVSVPPTTSQVLIKTTLSFYPGQSASFALKILSGSPVSGGVYYIGICPVTQPNNTDFQGTGRVTYHCHQYITYNDGLSERGFIDSTVSPWCNNPMTATAPLKCNYDGKSNDITFSDIYGKVSQIIPSPLPANQLYTFCFGIYYDTTANPAPTINPISLQIVSCGLDK